MGEPERMKAPANRASGLAKSLPAGALLGLLMVGGAGLWAFGQKKPPEKPIDLNTATSEQLQQLPGVGPVTAQAILDFRKKSGPFKRVSDILAIRGISKKRYQAISPFLTVGAYKAAPKPGAAPPKAAKPAAGGSSAGPPGAKDPPSASRR